MKERDFDFVFRTMEKYKNKHEALVLVPNSKKRLLAETLWDTANRLKLDHLDDEALEKLLLNCSMLCVSYQVWARSKQIYAAVWEACDNIIKARKAEREAKADRPYMAIIHRHEDGTVTITECD